MTSGFKKSRSLIGGEEMLTVDQYAYIRIAHRVYGKSLDETGWTDWKRISIQSDWRI